MTNTHLTLASPAPSGSGLALWSVPADSLFNFNFDEPLNAHPDDIKNVWPSTKIPSFESSDRIFSYESLPQRSIRLAKITRPGRIDFKVFSIDTINCRYVAVSYCWGCTNSSSQHHVIEHVDGRSVRVSKPVAAIIGRVLDRYTEAIIWIDSICIDQGNSYEKSHQVALMSEIYSKAAKTLVWLGEADTYTQIAFEAIDEQFIHTKPFRKDLSESIANLHPGFQLLDTGHIPLREEQVQALGHLLALPWFNRIWIFQEIILSHKAVFWCGNLETHGLKLKSVVSELPNLFSGPEFYRLLCDNGTTFNAWDHLRPELRRSLPTYHGLIPPSGFLNVPLFSRMQQYMKVSPTGARYLKVELSSLVGITTIFDATDPRDKLFALVSLARSELPIDYSLSTQQVLIKSMKYLLLNEGSAIHLLGLAGWCFNTPFDLPTWVPDLSSCRRLTTWSMKDTFSAGCANGENSTSESHRGVKIDDIENILTLRGLVVDTVSSVYSPAAEAFDEKSLHRLHLDRSSWAYRDTMLLLLLDFMFSIAPYPNGEQMSDVVRETMTAARVRPGTQKSEYMEGFKTWLRHIKRLDVLETRLKTDIQAVSAETEKPPSPPDDESTMALFNEAITNCSIGERRWPFWTRGGYLGIGLNGIQVGDKICLFQFAHVPYVIRADSTGSHPGTYSLVCESYIHGLMDGELMSETKLENISLR